MTWSNEATDLIVPLSVFQAHDMHSDILLAYNLSRILNIVFDKFTDHLFVNS